MEVPLRQPSHVGPKLTQAAQSASLRAPYSGVAYKESTTEEVWFGLQQRVESLASLFDKWMWGRKILEHQMKVRTGFTQCCHFFKTSFFSRPWRPSNWADIAAHLKPRSLEPGELLFAQGGSEATLFIVASGILEITQLTELSGQQTAGYIGAGDYMGEVSLLTGASYAATATARTRCKLYGLGCNVIKPLLAANSDLYAEFDRAARRGLAVLHRGVAIRASDENARQSLLHRIRAFFDDPT